MARARSSLSPLSDPKTLIHKLAVDIQEYIHLPDPSPFYIALSTVAANMIPGHPVWLMLVGPGGAGKTQAIMAVTQVKGVHLEGALESKAALMSGVSKKERAKGATGGLLFEVGQRGVLALKDFTNTLSQSQKELGEVVGALRDVHDGEYLRQLGTDGGHRFVWTGSIGFLGACTSKIDSHSMSIGELGQRWMFYRYGETDGYHESWKALSLSDRGMAARLIQKLVKEFFDAVCLEFSCYEPCRKLANDAKHTCKEGPAHRPLTDQEKSKFISWATIASRCRSIVPREERTYERVSTPDIEPPMRLSEGLGQLYLGMEAIGLTEPERWKLIEKVAWDSITPRGRGRVMRRLFEVGSIEGWHRAVLTIGECEALLNVGTSAARRVIEDLQALDVLAKWDSKVGRSGHPAGSGLTEWSIEEMNRCLRK